MFDSVTIYTLNKLIYSNNFQTSLKLTLEGKFQVMNIQKEFDKAKAKKGQLSWLFRVESKL